MLGNSNLGPRKRKNQRAPIEQHRKLACFHPATKILVIAVGPYIAASEMQVHVYSLHKCNQIIYQSCFFFQPAGKKHTTEKKICVTFMQTRDMYLHFTRSNVWANGNRYNFSSRVKTRQCPMLFNGSALIFAFSRTQVRIAEIERLQSLFKMSMSCTETPNGKNLIRRLQGATMNI